MAILTPLDSVTRKVLISPEEVRVCLVQGHIARKWPGQARTRALCWPQDGKTEDS